jgi:EAL domain-containing protein (putative c-di-GMP-specific phosphodiesterase class I)
VDYQGTMSINLPPAAMTDLRIPEMVTTMAVKAACDAERLQFEITETSLPPDPAKAIDILARMRLKGFVLSIDDFGTGHSSLEQLRKLPFSELKIDLSFVRGAETDIAARVIVENSIELGRQLNLAVLAEGVENEVIWRWLRDVGCELAQGFFVAKPMPLEHLLSWHHEWREKMSDLNQYTERLAPNSANAEA